jgi:hypothetical protein
MTFVLLESYLGSKEFDEFIDKFYEAVAFNDLVKHFVILAKKTTIIQDLKRYSPYLISKSYLEYARPPSASSSSEIQLPELQFSEILVIMNRIFRQLKFDPDHVPQLTHEILEIIEETRSQTADTTPSVLKAKEVDSERISLFLKRNKIKCDVMPSKAIKTEKGLKHECWIRVADDDMRLLIYGKIFIKDQAFDDQINEIIDRQEQKESIVNLQLIRDAGPQHFYSSHSLPYASGIPIRLLIRYLHRFSSDMAAVYNFDENSILEKNS